MLAKLTTAVSANWLKTLRPAFALAARQGIIPEDPLLSVKPRRHRTKGFRAWTREELDAFRAAYPVGTEERLIFDVALWTCQGRQEVARMGWQHVRDGMIYTTRGKTGTPAVCVIEPELVESLRIAEGRMMFIHSARGKPHSPEGLGNRFRSICDAIGLAGLSMHGLRKAGLIMHAENGCTEQMLMAIAGHLSSAEAAYYVRAANRTKLAQKAHELSSASEKTV